MKKTTCAQIVEVAYSINEKTPIKEALFQMINVARSKDLQLQNAKVSFQIGEQKFIVCPGSNIKALNRDFTLSTLGIVQFDIIGPWPIALNNSQFEQARDKLMIELPTTFNEAVNFLLDIN